MFTVGAVIAEQIIDGYGTKVEWITANPVSGNSARIRRSGAFYDDDAKKRER